MNRVRHVLHTTISLSINDDQLKRGKIHVAVARYPLPIGVRNEDYIMTANKGVQGSTQVID